MNILVTGSKGQLGNEIQKATKPHSDWHFFYTDVNDLDITQESMVMAFCKDNAINFIINCAAYTAVDNAEDDTTTAALINNTAVEILGKAAAKNNAKIIHISTDYVYAGTACEPYREDQPTAPHSVYGYTKLDGELALIKQCPGAIIIRTSWLYSSFGNNFVKTITALGKKHDELKVIFDQVGTPTYAADLAKAILEIINQNAKTTGVFHFSNEGACSWYDFAHSLLKLQNIACHIIPVESSEFPSKVDRPHYSVLNKKRIKDSYHIAIPHWEESLAECLKIM